MLDKMGNIYSSSNKSLKSVPSDEIVRTNAFYRTNSYEFIKKSMTCSHNQNVYLCRNCR